MTMLFSLFVPLLVRVADAPPEPEDVKAGWLGFVVFLVLAAAVVFLAFSLRKHLGKVDFEEAADRDAPVREDAPGHDEAPGHEATNGDRPSAR